MYRRIRVAISLLALLAFVAGCGPTPASEPTAPPEPVATAEPTTPPEPTAPPEPTTPPEPAAPEGVKLGGTLRAAFGEAPATLDVHKTTSTIPRYIASHIFEGLFAYGEGYIPRPMLVQDYVVSDDGLVWNFTLREGVLFHNGKELTSEDVIASLKRWGTIGSLGKRIFGFIENIEATGPYGLKLELNAPCGGLLDALSTTRQGALIYTSEVVERIGTEGELSPTVEDLIGTGPFRFVEFIPDRHLKLARYEDYSPREGSPDGYAGRREAYVDELWFVGVPDPATRLPTLQAGEVHYAHDLPVVEFDTAESDPEVEPLLGAPNYLTPNLNLGGGLLADKPLLRQAMQAAIDVEEIMKASVVDERFWRLDPSVMWKETGYWCDTGSELYNQADPEKAERLLAEAGYDGEPIRWLVAREIPYLYDASLVAESQLEEVGFNIDLQVLDWPTISKLRYEPESWEIFFNWSTYRADPAAQTWTMPNWANQWATANPEVAELHHKFSSEVDYEARHEIWCEIQELAYTDVPGIKFGDYFPFTAIRKEVKGYQNLPEPFFWNVWLEQP